MKKKFFLWFFLLIFLTTYNYHGKKKSFPNFFFIKQIEIVGVKNSNKEELELRLDKIRSKNIIFLSEKDFSSSKGIVRDFQGSAQAQRLQGNMHLIIKLRVRD